MSKDSEDWKKVFMALKPHLISLMLRVASKITVWILTIIIYLAAGLGIARFFMIYSTEFGPCVGLNAQYDSRFNYETNKNNFMVGVFAAPFFVPLYVFVNHAACCPVGVKK
jgi:hypothetical protein